MTAKVKVICTHFLTRERKEFDGFEHCASYFKVKKHTIVDRLKMKGAKTYNGGWVILRETDYKEIEDIEFITGFLTRCIYTGRTKIFDTFTDLKNHTEINEQSIKYYLKTDPKEKIFNGAVQIKRISDKTPWRPLKDFKEEHHFNKKRPVLRICKKTKRELFLLDLEEASHYSKTGFRTFLEQMTKNNFYENDEYIFYHCERN